MPSNINIISQLDYDAIKENLKIFLQNQSEFSDYNFEGSGLNILLEILALNTHYNAYYLNMAANEAFLDTAVLRDSVVSHAKMLGYTPYSISASKAIIDMNIDVKNNDATITLPRGFTFRSEILDNESHQFVLLSDQTASAANGKFYFENLEIHEGSLIPYDFIYNATNNPKRVFDIADVNIDTTSIKVQVRSSESNTEINVYTLASDILDIDNTSQVYFLQESIGGKYQIYFGDGIIGKELTNGSIVTVSYLVTNGSLADNLSNFVATSSVGSYTSFNIHVTSNSTGGDDRQAVDSIKYSATAQYSTQNRLVTIKDYEIYLKNKYSAIDSLSIWGGEEETPPIYGKVFISIKPKNNYYISETEKQTIKENIIDPKAMISIDASIIDPEYLFILVQVDAKYNRNKTILTSQQIKNAIRNKIISYNASNLNSFSSVLVVSKLQDDIDSADTSIIGNDVTLKLQKKFKPILNIPYTYTIKFNVPLKKGSSANKLSSSEFYMKDLNDTTRLVVLEEIPNSDTGISAINVTNAGYGYTSIPTVTITGDGYGAEAIAKIVNGKLESFEITKRGFDYSKATITITGGNGLGASGTVIVDSKIGGLRTVYFDSNAGRQIVNPAVGTINYTTGEIKLNDLKILSTMDNSENIKIIIESQTGIIESIKNTILYIDQTDPSAILVNLQYI